MGNTNCPVCNTPIDLQTRFCPTCGFERHIFPNGVSDKVQADEDLRIKKAQEFYEAKSAADNAKKEMQSKLDEANEALKDEKKAHKKTKTALENEKTDHEETKSNLEDEKKAHEKTESDLEDEKKAHEETKTALKKEQTAHEETKSDLAKEQTAHNRTKDALKDEEAAHEETKKKLDDVKKNPPTPPRPVPPPTPSPNKKVIGNALFTLGGRSEAVDLYEGVCRVTAPAWTNVKGELFEITCDNGMYFLSDLSGSMYNRHEREISRLVTVRNRDAFRIGELIIRLSFPKQ